MTSPRDSERDLGEEVFPRLVLAHGVHCADDDLVRDGRVGANRHTHFVFELGRRELELRRACLEAIVVVIAFLFRNGETDSGVVAAGRDVAAARLGESSTNPRSRDGPRADAVVRPSPDVWPPFPPLLSRATPKCSQRAPSSHPLRATVSYALRDRPVTEGHVRACAVAPVTGTNATAKLTLSVELQRHLPLSRSVLTVAFASS